MKRAPAQKHPSTKALVPVPRKCTRQGCDNYLKPVQRKYCSPVCKNIVMKGPDAGTGRPPVYKPEYATTVLELYYAECEQKNKPDLIPTESSYIVIHNARPPGKDEYRWFLAKNGYCTVSDTTFDNWEKNYSEFAYAMAELVKLQRSYLLQNGLAGRYNPQITKLVLGVNHGMVERKEMDHTHKFLGIVKHLYQKADELDKGHGH